MCPVGWRIINFMRIIRISLNKDTNSNYLYLQRTIWGLVYLIFISILYF